MGTQIADLYAKIRADTSELDKGLSHAQGAMGQAADAMGGALDHVSSRAVALGVVLGNVVTAGLTQLTQAVTGLASGMISGNAEFERYQTQFTVLLRSADAAKQRLAELAEFGKVTPFELPEVVQADKILQAFGLHAENVAQRFGMAGDEIRTVAGDVAAGTGAAFTEISTYIGKFASGATGEAIARFQELGIVTRDELRRMGLEFSKSGELISPLDKSMTVLLAVMKDKFGGMMDAQSRTFEGMMSNLKDWFGQAQRLAGEPLFKATKDQLQSLLDLLNSPAMTQGIQQMAESIGQGVSKAIETAKSAIAGFKSAGLGGAATGILSSLGLDDKAASMVGAAINQIVEAVQTGMAKAREAFAAAQPYLAVLGDALMSAVPVVATLADLLGDVLAGALNALGTATQFVLEHWQPFAAILAVVGGLLAGAGIAAAVAGIGAALSALGAAVGVAVAAIGALLTPIGLLIAGVALLAVAWSNNWGDIQGIAFRVVATVQALIAALGGSMKAIGEGLRVALTEGPAAGYAAFQKSMAGVDATYQQAIAAVPQRGEEMRQGFAASWDSTIATVKDKLGGMLSTQDTGLAAMVANAQQRAAEIRLALAGAQGASLAAINATFGQGQLTGQMDRDITKAEAMGRSLTPKAQQAAAAVVAPIKAFNAGVVSGLGGGGGGGAGAKAAKTVEEQILEAANVIRSVTETVAKLKEFLAGGELSKLKSPEGADQIIEVAVWVTDLGKTMAEKFREAAGSFKEEGNKAAAALADAIGSATSAIGNVAGMLVKLGDLMKHDKWPDMQANMGRMQEIAQQLLGFGLGLAQTLVPAAQGMSEDAAKSAQYMAQAIQAAAQATAAVADLLPKLWEFTQRPEFDDIMASRKELLSVAKKLIAWGKDLAKSFVSAAKGMSEQAAKSAQNLATAIQSATSSVTQVLDLIPKLLAFRADPGLIAVLDNKDERASVLHVAKGLISLGAVMARDFASAAKGLKDKAVIEAKRLADIIGSTSQGLTAVDAAVRLLLGIMGQQSLMAVISNQDAWQPLRQLAAWLGALARVLSVEWAAAAGALSGVTVAVAQRLTEGIKAVSEGLSATYAAVVALAGQGPTISRLASLGSALISYLVALTTWLAHLAAYLANEWGHVASLLNQTTTGQGAALTTAVQSARDGILAVSEAILKLCQLGPTISRLAALGPDLTGYLIALTEWLAHLAAFLSNEWDHVASLLDQTTTTQGAALTAAIRTVADGLVGMTEALDTLLLYRRRIDELARQGEPLIGYLRALTGWLGRLAVLLANDWDWLAGQLDVTTTQAGQALADAIEEVASGIGSALDAVTRLAESRHLIDTLARQGEPLIGYLRNLTSFLARLAILLANDWDWLAGRLDITTTQTGRALTDAVGVVASGIGSVLDAVTSLLLNRLRIDALSRQGQPLIDSLRDFASWLGRLGIQLATAWNAVADSFDASQSGAGSALADAVSTVAGGLRDTYDAARLLVDIGQRGLPTVDLALVTDLVTLARSLVTQAQAALREWQPDSALQQALSDLADGLSSFTGLMGDVLDVAQTFLDQARLLGSVLTSEGLPILALTDFVENALTTAQALVAVVQPLVSEIDGVVLDSLSDLNDAISALTGVMSGVIDAITLYFDTLYGGDKWSAWIDASLYSVTIQRFIQAWAQRLVDFGEALRTAAVAAVNVVDETTLAAYRAAADNLGNLGDVLGGLNDVMGGVLGIIRLYFDTLYGDDKWARWMEEALYSPTIQMFIKAWVKRLIDFGEELRTAANEAIGTINRDGIDSLSNLGDSLSALSGVTGSVLDIFRAYLDAIDDKIQFNDGYVQAKVKQLVGVLVVFGVALRQEGLDALDRAEVTTLEAIPAMGALGTALSDLSGVMGSTLDIFRTWMDAVDDKIQFNDALVQAKVKQLVGVLVVFGVALRQEGLDALNRARVTTLEAIPAMEALGKALGDLSGVTGSALDIFRAYMDAVKDKVDYNNAEVQARVKTMTGVLVTFGLALRDAAKAALDAQHIADLEAMPALEKLASALGNIGSILKDALDISKLSKDMAAYKPQSVGGVINAKLQIILDDVIAMAKAFAAKAQGAGLSEDLQKAADALAQVFGNASGAIKDAIDIGMKLMDPDTLIPSKEQMTAKIGALLDVVDVAVSAFGARAAAAAASGLDVAGLASYAGAVKGVFEAIGEVAAAVQSFTGIYTGPGIGQSSGFANIKATLDQIFALFEDAARHADLVARVTSTITTALDGVTALASVKGADAGAAWLAGFAGAVGGMAMPQLAPAAAAGGTGGGQVIINNIQNTSRSISVSISPSTAEAGRAGVMGIYSLVMY